MAAKKVVKRAVAQKVTKPKAKKVVAKKKKPLKKSKISITERVEKVLDTVRPYLISDGGNIELLGVDEKNGVVTVHLVGACASCSSSQITLYSGVEQTLKDQIPEIVALVAV